MTVGGGLARYRFACWTSAAAFLLLIAGGLVTSTGSALAVPDWPLSYGKFFPPMVGGILFEHGHRMIAGLVAVMTWLLAVWTWRDEPRAWVRRVAAAAAGGIVLQAVLGGLTVLLLLPASIAVAHACLGQTVFCLLLILAEATSPWFLAPSPSSSPTRGRGKQGDPSSPEGEGKGERVASSLWKWGVAAVAAVYLQLILGAIIRHTHQDVAWHLIGALWTTAAVLGAAYQGIGTRDAALFRPAVLAGALVPLQIVLGISAWAVRSRPPLRMDFWRIVLPTAHVACGAAILGALVVWSLRAYRLQIRINHAS